jgi:hypothetical protein
MVSSSFCTPWMAKRLVSKGTITSLVARNALKVSRPTLGGQSISAKSYRSASLSSALASRSVRASSRSEASFCSKAESTIPEGARWRLSATSMITRSR